MAPTIANRDPCHHEKKSAANEIFMRPLFGPRGAQSGLSSRRVSRGRRPRAAIDERAVDEIHSSVYNVADSASLGTDTGCHVGSGDSTVVLLTGRPAVVVYQWPGLTVHGVPT